MEINLTRSERIIAIIAFIAISIFFVMFLQLSRGSKSAPQFDTGSTIDYTMARPDQAYSEYTLDGRELDHTFMGLNNGKNETKLSKVKKELIAKKIAEIKKKDEIKKNQVALAKAQSQTLLPAQPEKTQLIKDKRKSTESPRDKQQPNNSYAGPNNNVAPPQTTVVIKDPKSHKKTFTEWRSLIFGSPTTENIALFITSLRKGEVTATEYQAMAQDLIEQNDNKLKGLGLMALRSTPSLASLSQLAHLQPTSFESYQAYIEQSLNAYLQPQNLQFLNQALLTQDKTLIVKSLVLLSTNLIKFSQGDLSGLIDPRNRREGEVASFSMNNFRALLPVLNQLGLSAEPEFSSLAQQIVALIQTYNNVAQN